MVTVGIIGCGVIGRTLYQEFLAHPAFRVVAVWDPSAAAVAALLTQGPEDAAACAVSGPEAVVQAADLVYVASPPAFHVPQALMALAAGKACLCEKPLAVDLAEGARLAAQVAAGSAPVAVHYPLATAPAVLEIQRRIAAGGIGTVTGVRIEARFARWPRGWHTGGDWLTGRAEGGFIREVLSHFLFVTLRTFGALSIHSAKAVYPASGGCETRLDALLSAGGIPVELTACVGGDDDDYNVWQIDGTMGRLRTTGWFTGQVWQQGHWQPLLPGTVAEGDALTQRAVLDGLAAMMARQPHRLATVAEALDVQRCVEVLRQAE
ncbi:Gfo/Idh/MocA family protein [Novispirillum itersonii]|uniref:Putative dehydrogenase n=1 Tax=Novispirillum itersonii TaxID=189 RepID=A0A7W9ZCD2_NOVIT|nr:Gfo/Idh/MocA family oxidoreductase [Novispirillum itersonii]MBB6208648.1 putative dehydrogenase [Novispirillum itersonii]